MMANVIIKPSSARRLILMLVIIGLPFVFYGQQRTPSAVWFFPAVSWRAAKGVRLQGQLGYNNYLRMGLFYPQAFFTVHKNIILNTAYIYAVQKYEGSAAVQEHWLMNAVIWQAAKKNFLIDDRNMLWNRFTVGGEPRHYYRNRLRVAQTFNTKPVNVRLYAYEEVYYLFSRGNWSRNRAAVGISSDLTKNINADVLYIRQWDRYGGRLNLFFVTGTWQW